jgi:hypothetical protein
VRPLAERFAVHGAFAAWRLCVNSRAQVHAMPEKDFFDCGTASFYNFGVLKTTGIVLP